MPNLAKIQPCFSSILCNTFTFGILPAQLHNMKMFFFCRNRGIPPPLTTPITHSTVVLIENETHCFVKCKSVAGDFKHGPQAAQCRSSRVTCLNSGETIRNVSPELRHVTDHCAGALLSVLQFAPTQFRAGMCRHAAFIAPRRCAECGLADSDPHFQYRRAVGGL